MTLLNKELFDRSIEGLSGNYYIELKPAGVRSSQQNNYYWSIVKLLAEELGYTESEMHQAIKNHFNILSTKSLTTKEFSEYIERIIRWSAIDLHIVIPDPKTLL